MTVKKLKICFIIYIYIIFNMYNFVIATEITNENESNENADNQTIEEMKIYSESAILIEAKTGKILYEKNIHDKKYPASTTKILTAIIAIEKCDLNEKAIASYGAINSLEPGYTKADIQVGETFTIKQLLEVLMVQSANESANIIAEHISGSVSEFAKLMNDKAKEIGCVESNFVNPNGMHNENHYSSVYDLSVIAKYCMQNETFRELAKMMETSLPRTEYWQDEQIEEHGERNFKNTNSLLIPENTYYYPYAIGIKTGFTTPAKNCLVSASNKDGFETIAVVLHAEATDEGLSARYLDTINLFEYGYNNYDIEDIQKEYPNIIVEENNNIDLNNEEYTEQLEIKNEEKINITKEIIEIGIGIVFLIIAIAIIFPKRKGKHECRNMYKFNLNQ